MSSKFFFLLKYYLFWIFLAVLARIIFLLYESGQALTRGEYAEIFFRGIRMDLSLGGYILLLACVFMAFVVFVSYRVLQRIYAIYTAVLLLIFWLVVTVDLELFENWGYHLDATPLMYLKTPKEALASTPFGLMLGLIGLWLMLTAVCYYVFRRFILVRLKYRKGGIGEAVFFLLLGGCMILPIRGGFNVAPMNSSFVYFHKTNMFANQAAINPVWNFMYEVTHMSKVKNKYRFMPEQEANRIVDRLYSYQDSFPVLLKTKRPDVVVLLLESFSADAIEVLGGEKGVTPHLNALAKEGVLFTRIYSTGPRSDRGIAGVIGAIPSHPDLSILKYPNKTAVRPRFPNEMENAGYHTRFYYAGDINFGGFRSFVTMSFQDMVTEDDFSGKAKEVSFKWGVHDEFMFERLFEDITKAPRPFMYMAFNMSSHEPFEVPMKTQIPGETPACKFMNAIYYTDKCIGEFVEKCKTAGIWDNLLLVLVADHGSIRLKNRQPFEAATYHIPFILSGGALNVRDTTVSVVGSQTDVVATVFAQLGIDHSMFRYSKNLLAKEVTPFAYYTNANLAGVVTDKGVSVYDLKSKQFILGDTLAQNKLYLQAYLQVVDEDLN